MSTRAIVSAALAKAADLRTANNGNAFATFTLRENVNGSTRWWRGIAFDEIAIEALKEMSAGEPISVAGEISAEIWAPSGGEPRLNWRITVDAVLTARRKPKPKVEKLPETGREIAARSWAAPSSMGDARG